MLSNRADARYNEHPHEAKRQLQEAERTLAQVASTYGNEKDGSQTLAERTKTALDNIRRLSAGKAAPVIEGEDADGKKFQLSDYKGKVVVLDFWAGW